MMEIRAKARRLHQKAGPRLIALDYLLGDSARLRLTQTRPVISRLGLGSKQCAQLTLLLGNKHADHLPAYLWHAHPTHIRNTFQPDQH